MDTDTENQVQLTEQERIHLHKETSAMGQAAMKAAMLINGGAVVAMLAFVGNVIKSVGSTLLSSLAWSMAFFCGGVLLAALAFGCAYRSGFSNILEIQSNQTKLEKTHKWIKLAVACTILSLICFSMGVVFGCLAFRSYVPATTMPVR